MSNLPWCATVRLVHERANYTCEYCQTRQSITGQAMHIEHIDPNGGDHPDNLALACANCNQSKSKATEAIDPTTNQIAPLFHPRRHSWTEHFIWRESDIILEGIPPIGRATIVRLKINQERMIISRQLWVKMGVHPPE
jgi:5-methylcytosine-specific restriction endonuclease McrA